MPKEIFLVELWKKYADQADEIRVKRYDKFVKLKARLKKYLYVIKLPPDWANQLIEEYRGKGKRIVEF